MGGGRREGSNGMTERERERERENESSKRNGARDGTCRGVTLGGAAHRGKRIRRETQDF